MTILKIGAFLNAVKEYVSWHICLLFV